MFPHHSKQHDHSADTTDYGSGDEHRADPPMIEYHTADHVGENSADSDGTRNKCLPFDLIVFRHIRIDIVGRRRYEDRICKQLERLTDKHHRDIGCKNKYQYFYEKCKAGYDQQIV